MSLSVDGEIKWKEWGCIGMFVNDIGRYMRLTDGEVCIWYEVTADGFEFVSNEVKSDSLEIIFQERHMQ